MSSIRTIGLAAAGLQVALAAALAWIASGSSAFPNPPEVVPRGLALGLLYAVPGVVAALGAAGARRAVLGAAAMSSTVGSVVALSAVTLIFLVPALLFGTAAGASMSPRSAPSAPVWRVLLIVVVAVPVVALAVLWLGIFVIPAIVVPVVIIEAVRRASSASLGSQVPGLAVGVIIAGLLIGSGWALLTFTETRCWTAYQTPNGIEYRTTPDVGGKEIRLRQDEIAGGCDSGELTPRGAIFAMLLGLGAIGVAASVSLERSIP